MSHGSPDSPTKICTTEGCGRLVRARGLCSTHYNQTRPNRHAKGMKACAVCGTQALRPLSTSRTPTCSVQCRAIVQFGEVAGLSRYNWAIDAMGRAREAGATCIEQIDRDAVFERDHYTCYLCSCTVTAPSPFVLDSATVDHVVPLSKGGQHTMDNVATACLLCNSRKQADLVSSQAA